MLRFRENHGSGASICPISITYGLVMLIISRVVAIFATTLEIIREHVVANVIKRAGSRLLDPGYSPKNFPAPGREREKSKTYTTLAKKCK